MTALATVLAPMATARADALARLPIACPLARCRGATQTTLAGTRRVTAVAESECLPAEQIEQELMVDFLQRFDEEVATRALWSTRIQ